MIAPRKSLFPLLLALSPFGFAAVVDCSAAPTTGEAKQTEEALTPSITCGALQIAQCTTQGFVGGGSSGEGSSSGSKLSYAPVPVCTCVDVTGAPDAGAPEPTIPNACSADPVSVDQDANAKWLSGYGCTLGQGYSLGVNHGATVWACPAGTPTYPSQTDDAGLESTDDGGSDLGQVLNGHTYLTYRTGTISDNYCFGNAQPNWILIEVEARVATSQPNPGGCHEGCPIL
jgi:hypothetical protein